MLSVVIDARHRDQQVEDLLKREVVADLAGLLGGYKQWAGPEREQDLWCEPGRHEWRRPSQRGRPPRACPQHAQRSGR
jgi:hypothetical protein